MKTVIPKNFILLVLVWCFICVVNLSSASAATQEESSKRHLVIVTIDGLRWQEVFQGADAKLIEHPDFVQNPEALKMRFWDKSAEARQQKLMPFLSGVIAKKGMIMGDRNAGSNMSIENQQHFSYPGYNEIFTGKVDPTLTSNAKVSNKNITFLEWLNKQKGFANQVAVFSGWDVFPMIYNRERSRLFINAGFEAMPIPTTLNPAEPERTEDLLKRIDVLNTLQSEIPSPWSTVRHDAFTYGFAKTYLQLKQPRVLVINLGETDDFAHNGKYDAYLDSARRTDDYLRDLWTTLQKMPEYKNNTNLLIITDHGRGANPDDWQHHASASAVRDYMTSLSTFEEGIVGSEHIWFAAIGPDVHSKGLVKTKVEQTQSQFAPSALKLLGFDPHDYDSSAKKSIQGLTDETNK
ncbi:alkaline phosphatase family protein [Brumicola blandensis]|uniref:Alkaline phosphatase family protein n=1 Tax=Brumicola blandensis TaxID=3075611 RepID=A0AAW8R6K2_9ALTE|nr:alkaline phosphatase family protein [Alteromonas sp. W409]MDT0583776.1 alkaline phosphatase family protein [Alteromonas sp. W409]